MAGTKLTRICAVTAAFGLLAGCDQNGEFNLFSGAGRPEAAVAADTGAEGGTFVEQDVEAPDVFAAREPGLWDGRPSFGRIWVAHPEVSEPERVRITNPANGETVIGSLFRREVDNPGPRFQVSSDAAAALGMLAGQPAELDVVALRREQVMVAPPPGAVSEEAPPLATDGIESQSLDPVATAAAAIAAAEGEPPAIESAPEAAAQPAAAAAPPASSLEKPFVQIGIFNEKGNADAAAEQLRGIGIVPTVREQESVGKRFWRVIVGPATSTAERRRILAEVRKLGFDDAYFVSS